MHHCVWGGEPASLRESGHCPVHPCCRPSRNEEASSSCQHPRQRNSRFDTPPCLDQEIGSLEGHLRLLKSIRAKKEEVRQMEVRVAAGRQCLGALLLGTLRRHSSSSSASNVKSRLGVQPHPPTSMHDKPAVHHPGRLEKEVCPPPPPPPPSPSPSLSRSKNSSGEYAVLTGRC